MLRSLGSRVATLLPGTSSGLGAMFSRGMATAKRRVVVMGRARRGLYDGKHISFGNKISFAGNKCAARAPAASLSGASQLNVPPAAPLAERDAPGSRTL